MPTLATQISRLVDDESLRQKLGKAGRKHMSSAFIFERMLDESEAYYRKVAATAEKSR